MVAQNQAFPPEIFFQIFDILHDQGDVTTLKRCKFIAPAVVQGHVDSIFDITKRHPTLHWNQGQRIRQFVKKIQTSTGFATDMKRLSLTTNVGTLESGGAITRRLDLILTHCTNLTYLELEMNPAAKDFIPPTSLWAMPSSSDDPADFVTSKLDTLKLKGFQPFKAFKFLIEGLSGSSLRRFELAGHDRIEDDISSAQDLVDLFNRNRKAFANVTTFELGARCDMFLMALDMMLPDLNVFPSGEVFTCSPESPNAVACAFAVARGMGDTITSFKWHGLHSMSGTHENIISDIRSGAISLATLPKLKHLSLPIVVGDADTTPRYLSSDDVLSIIETIPTNNAIESMEFTYHFFNTEHLLYGRAWDHRNELIPYFRTEKSCVIGPQVNRLYNIALANKHLFPVLKKIAMKVFAPFESEDVNPAARYKMILQAWSNLVFRLVHNHEFESFMESVIHHSVAPLRQSGVEVGVEVKKWVPYS